MPVPVKAKVLIQSSVVDRFSHIRVGSTLLFRRVLPLQQLFQEADTFDLHLGVVGEHIRDGLVQPPGAAARVMDSCDGDPLLLANGVLLFHCLLRQTFATIH